MADQIDREQIQHSWFHVTGVVSVCVNCGIHRRLTGSEGKFLTEYMHVMPDRRAIIRMHAGDCRRQFFEPYRWYDHFNDCLYNSEGEADKAQDTGNGVITLYRIAE